MTLTATVPPCQIGRISSHRRTTKLLGDCNWYFPRRLETLSELIAAGKVTPVIDRTYPLIEAPDASYRGGAYLRVVVAL